MEEELVKKFQEKGTGDILGDIKMLRMTTEERVLDLLNRIEYEYKYDAGPSYGTLTESEVKYRYDALLGSLSNIPGLSDEERVRLETKIQEKIRDIPRVELAGINAFLKNDEAVDFAVKEIAEDRGISYDEAKKEFLTSAKERVDRYNKIIEEQNSKSDDVPKIEDSNDSRE